MTLAVRPVGYSNSYGELTVTSAIAGAVTAYLWGGGGGGGGGPDAAGSSGSGGGGGFSLVNFTVSEGDVIGVGVGGGGAVGATAATGTGGGRGGNGYTTSLSWSTLNLLTDSSVIRSTNGSYVNFLNTYGVWNTNIYSGQFEKTVTINFPQTSVYTITGSADNRGWVYVDDVQVLYIGGYSTTYSTTVTLNAGDHTIAIYGINFEGPASIGVTITGINECYSGATGGNPGPYGSSGAGGGGGAATVLFLNNTLIGVAGGGGGGGGAGRYGAVTQSNAPGLNEFAPGEHAGQDGQSYYSDGGGGGAGGGGRNAGQGGLTRGYETTGYGGGFGSSYSSNGSTADPSGAIPGGSGYSYWNSSVGTGGKNGTTLQTPTSGANGFAVFEFNQRTTAIKNGGNWSQINTVYIKQSGSWKQVKGAWIKQNGVWVPLFGANNNVPNFTAVSGRFGYAPRPAVPNPPPE